MDNDPLTQNDIDFIDSLHIGNFYDDYDSDYEDLQTGDAAEETPESMTATPESQEESTE